MKNGHFYQESEIHKKYLVQFRERDWAFPQFRETGHFDEEIEFYKRVYEHSKNWAFWEFVD